MVTLHNHHLQVTVNPKGAELTSLIQDSTEYIWQANPEFWKRHAPNLFPIVGTLVDHTYLYQNKAYSLPRHGFARDSLFKVQKQSDTSASFVLEEDSETLKSYPFPFRFMVSYTIENRSVKVTYRIEAKDKDLYYSVGGHPAFNCPIAGYGKRSDYALKFSQKEILERELLNDEGLLSKQKERVLNDEQILPITDDLFNRDALVFREGIRSDKITLVDPAGRDRVIVDRSNFPALGIWSASSGSPFVCIEPWAGYADEYDHSKDFTKKAGQNYLAAGGSTDWSYTVEIPA